MKNLFLYGVLAAFLLINAACSGTASVNTTTANKPANSNMAVVVNNNATTNTPAVNTTAANTATNTAASNSDKVDGTTHNAGGDQDFKLNNETGVDIHALYVSPSDTDDWEKDILGRDTLPNGESVEITFDRAEKAAKWDLRVEDKSGNFIVWENLDLMAISDVTLNYKDGKATAITK